MFVLHALRAFVCRLHASPAYASITISCLKPQTAYGFAVQSRKTVKTEGAASEESSLLELCRVATEEGCIPCAPRRGNELPAQGNALGPNGRGNVRHERAKELILNAFALSGRENDRCPNIPRAPACPVFCWFWFIETLVSASAPFFLRRCNEIPTLFLCRGWGAT